MAQHSSTVIQTQNTHPTPTQNTNPAPLPRLPKSPSFTPRPHTCHPDRPHVILERSEKPPGHPPTTLVATGPQTGQPSYSSYRREPVSTVGSGGGHAQHLQSHPTSNASLSSPNAAHYTSCRLRWDVGARRCGRSARLTLPTPSTPSPTPHTGQQTPCRGWFETSPRPRHGIPTNTRATHHLATTNTSSDINPSDPQVAIPIPHSRHPKHRYCQPDPSIPTFPAPLQSSRALTHAIPSTSAVIPSEAEGSEPVAGSNSLVHRRPHAPPPFYRRRPVPRGRVRLPLTPMEVLATRPYSVPKVGCRDTTNRSNPAKPTGLLQRAPATSAFPDSDRRSSTITRHEGIVAPTFAIQPQRPEMDYDWVTGAVEN